MYHGRNVPVSRARAATQESARPAWSRATDGPRAALPTAPVNPRSAGRPVRHLRGRQPRRPRATTRAAPHKSGGPKQPVGQRAHVKAGATHNEGLASRRPHLFEPHGGVMRKPARGVALARLDDVDPVVWQGRLHAGRWLGRTNVEAAVHRRIAPPVTLRGEPISSGQSMQTISIAGVREGVEHRRERQAVEHLAALHVPSATARWSGVHAHHAWQRGGELRHQLTRSGPRRWLRLDSARHANVRRSAEPVGPASKTSAGQVRHQLRRQRVASKRGCGLARCGPPPCGRRILISYPTRCSSCGAGRSLRAGAVNSSVSGSSNRWGGAPSLVSCRITLVANTRRERMLIDTATPESL